MALQSVIRSTVFPGEIVTRGVKHAKPTRQEIKEARRARILRLEKLPGFRDVKKPCDATEVREVSAACGQTYAVLSNSQRIRKGGAL